MSGENGAAAAAEATTHQSCSTGCNQRTNTEQGCSDRCYFEPPKGKTESEEMINFRLRLQYAHTHTHTYMHKHIHLLYILNMLISGRKAERSCCPVKMNDVKLILMRKIALKGRRLSRDARRPSWRSCASGVNGRAPASIVTAA